MTQKSLTSKEFFELITSSDLSEINKVSKQIISRLELYLVSVYNAEKEVAKDCAQETFQKIFVKITDEEITGIDDIYGYFINSVKNEYLMSLRREKFEVPIEHASYEAEEEGTPGEDVVNSLYTEEREKLLEYCIEKLREGRKNFFLFVLEHINEMDADAARKIRMSHTSFRTKKSRVIEVLRDCVKNAMNL